MAEEVQVVAAKPAVTAVPTLDSDALLEENEDDD